MNNNGASSVPNIAVSIEILNDAGACSPDRRKIRALATVTAAAVIPPK